MTDLTTSEWRLLDRFLTEHEKALADPETAWGRCAIETGALATLLSRGGTDAYAMRVVGQNYHGREHWAVMVARDGLARPEDAAVIDVTARQFDAGAQVPWVGSLTDWYDDVEDWINDWIRVEVYYPHQTDGTYLTGDPLWSDEYGRDDHEPGDLVYPWQRSKEQR
ncbi:hypothetical protein [Nocardioides pakistanensis]